MAISVCVRMCVCVGGGTVDETTIVRSEGSSGSAVVARAASEAAGSPLHTSL